MKLKSYSGKSPLTLIRVIVHITCVALGLSMLSSPAFAKNKIYKGIDGTIQLALCRSMVDTKNNPKDQDESDKVGNSCCSKEYGYCIDCPRATPNVCTRYPYRLHSEVPTLPNSDVLAPTDDKPRPRWPAQNNLPTTGGVVAPTPRPAPNRNDHRMQTPRPAPNVYDHR